MKKILFIACHGAIFGSSHSSVMLIGYTGLFSGEVYFDILARAYKRVVMSEGTNNAADNYKIMPKQEKRI